MMLIVAQNTSHKRRFSHYASRTEFKDGVLVITGRKALTAKLLGLFLAACVGVLWLETPWLVKVGVFLSVLLLAYAVLDVLASSKVLVLDVAEGRVSLHRKSLQHTFAYDGPAAGKLRVEKRLSSSDTSKSYSIFLVFDDGTVDIPYPLQFLDVAEGGSDAAVQLWRERLRLAG